MPAVQPSPSSRPLVLVTGATGYIAAWVARYLLKRGYNVRGTVRSTTKGQQLLEHFQNLSDESKKMGKFHFVVVEDIGKKGSFDEVVKDVDAIEHIASPVRFDADDPIEVIAPAVNGTIGLLESVKKYGGNVKRVIITSSLAATSAATLDRLPIRFDDDPGWNEKVVRAVEELGREASGSEKYRASKTLAEKAVWDFVSQSPSLQWDVVTLIPPYVFGPTTNHVSSPENLSFTAGLWYKTLVSQDAGGKSAEELEAIRFSWADVRDVAESHVRALEKEEAGGKRIIVSNDLWSWQEWLDIANSLSPPPYTKHPLARGNPDTKSSVEPASLLQKIERTKRLLVMSNDEDADWKYKTKEETTRDTLADFAARGW
ncbi:NAD(P)-binding protein [Marasmius fiardii PR-910]|nr:NAD(P)-binding protein [Marasmius fiardii PR-910]